MVCPMQIMISFLSSRNTAEKCMHEEKMGGKTFCCYCKYFNMSYAKALVIADQLSKDLFLGLCV